MLIYCCIDGTDNHDPSAIPAICMIPERTASLENSHVKRIGYLGIGGRSFKYFRGTDDSITGASSSLIIDEAIAWITRVYGDQADSTRKLFLGGFSRGGAAALVIAHRLKARNIPVQEMFLFDAVDRSWSMEDTHTASVPDNVVRAFHAVRDPRSASRQSFGNCGMVGSGNNLEKKAFMTTHGGVGGWPNGEAMVKPGAGAEDYGYYAAERMRVAMEPIDSFGDAARFVTPGANTYVAAQRARDRINADPRQMNIHERGAPFPTNISPAQEREGMREVWTWMSGKALSTVYAG